MRVQKAWMGSKWYIFDWTCCSTRCVLSIVKIPHSPDCLRGRHWEDVSASQGVSQGHRTAMNTVESFIRHPDPGLWTPGGNIQHFIGTYLTTACLKKLTEKEREKYPQTTTALSQDFYVDYVLSRSDDITEALKLQADLITLLASAEFPLRNLCFNDPRILEAVPT